jgi:hypothetical protein
MRGRGLMLVAGMKMGQKQAATAAQLKQQGAEEAKEQMKQAPAPAPASTEQDSIAQIQNLAEMHNSGILSDEEFTAAKKKILGL